MKSNLSNRTKCKENENEFNQVEKLLRSFIQMNLMFFY
jgi:hypothetical protein